VNVTRPAFSLSCFYFSRVTETDYGGGFVGMDDEVLVKDCFFSCSFCCRSFTFVRESDCISFCCCMCEAEFELLARFMEQYAELFDKPQLYCFAGT